MQLITGLAFLGDRTITDDWALVCKHSGDQSVHAVGQTSQPRCWRESGLCFSTPYIHWSLQDCPYTFNTLRHFNRTLAHLTPMHWKSRSRLVHISTTLVLNQENADSPCTYGYVYIPGDAALKEVQKEKPAFQDGAQGWWKEVIRRTAIGAGADSQGSPSVTQECTSEKWWCETWCSCEPFPWRNHDKTYPSLSVTRRIQVIRRFFAYSCVNCLPFWPIHQLTRVVRALREMGIKTGVISNTDSAMRKTR